MMTTKMKYVTCLAVSALLVSCGGEETNDKTAQEDNKKPAVNNCIYEYSPEKTEVAFTAYKYLNRTGVGGTLPEMTVKGETSGASPKAIFESLSFSIPTGVVETNNEDRNKKIDSLFFGMLESTEMITGKVLEMNADKKKISLDITMNDVTNKVTTDYVMDDNKLKFSTDIDVNNWNAQEGIAALNKACKELHTNTAEGDTVSKLWSEVTIQFNSELIKNCD